MRLNFRMDTRVFCMCEISCCTDGNRLNGSGRRQGTAYNPSLKAKECVPKVFDY